MRRTVHATAFPAGGPDHPPQARACQRTGGKSSTGEVLRASIVGHLWANYETPRTGSKRHCWRPRNRCHNCHKSLKDGEMGLARGSRRGYFLPLSDRLATAPPDLPLPSFSHGCPTYPYRVHGWSATPALNPPCNRWEPPLVPWTERQSTPRPPLPNPRPRVR